MPQFLLAAITFIRGMNPAQWLVVGVIALLTVGLGHQLLKPDQKYIVRPNGTLNVNNCEKEEPLVGCAISRLKLKIVWQ